MIYYPHSQVVSACNRGTKDKILIFILSTQNSGFQSKQTLIEI